MALDATRRKQYVSYCNSHCITLTDEDNENLKNDVSSLLTSYQTITQSHSLQNISTWLLEKEIYVETENNTLAAETDSLGRGRVVLVNPGVDNIGREQRCVHYYIVLGEYEETFIGVPITNMAYDSTSNTYYIRHFFEVELKNPASKKPFLQFRVAKPSVADARNIVGLDKRRIAKNKLYYDKKYVPPEYLTAISAKIRDTLASI